MNDYDRIYRISIDLGFQSNAFLCQSVRRPLNEPTIKTLDDDYHKTIEA